METRNEYICIYVFVSGVVCLGLMRDSKACLSIWNVQLDICDNNESNVRLECRVEYDCC